MARPTVLLIDVVLPADGVAVGAPNRRDVTADGRQARREVNDAGVHQRPRRERGQQLRGKHRFGDGDSSTVGLLYRGATDSA